MNRKIILDIGNGSAHHNDINIICQSIDEVCRLQDKTDKLQFIIKTQIWSDKNEIVSKQLESTSWAAFSKGYEHAMKRGILLTSSVFDKESLDRLTCDYMVPFVKLANRTELYSLMDDSDVKFVVSVGNKEDYEMVLNRDHIPLLAVSKYPATPLDYVSIIEQQSDFDILDPSARGISDHTCDWGIYNRYLPHFYECHFSIDKSLINDKVGGTDFVREPRDIERIL